ncbi:phospholipase A2 [Herbidospora daliensis]|uniref:phospholipase A2 n=1 Tax=Herbidospora daliensis TaxID=295585 RepID=UPI0007851F6A|nr:phospholipase A2 [Herbidospora daliensis]
MTRSTRGLLRAAAMTITAALFLVGGPGTALAGADDEPDDPLEKTDWLLFEIPLADFVERAEDEDQELVWSAGDCSFAGGDGGFGFADACRRHDFGYRNYREQGRLTPEGRAKIDDQLLADVTALCARYRGWEAFRGVGCRGEGRVLHGLVRGVGRVHPAASAVGPAGRVVRLYVGADEPFAVGRLSGAAPGDTVWVDRSWNTGVTWIQLGPTRVQPFVTGAVTPPMWDRYQSLRACGQARGGAVACTRWVTV